ncbi:MAG TPA: hypothetical protein VGD65_17430 [Chryseosolibacter sp.]
MLKVNEGGFVKKDIFQLQGLDIAKATGTLGAIVNRPGRKSNPVPTRPEEEEEDEPKPGKEDPKRKKKKRAYEVTC